MSTISYRIITPPQPVVTLAQIKAFLGIDPADTTQDTLVQALIDGAIAYLDGPSGWLGRFIGQQTVEASIGFPYSTPIALCGPVVSISGATGIPGNFQYTLSGDSLMLPLCGRPIFGGGAPVPAVITYLAGSNPVPPSVALAIMLAVKDINDFFARDPTLKSEKAADTQFVYNTGAAMAGAALSQRTMALLSPLRVWR